MEGYNKLTPKLALELAAPHTWPASVCPALFGIAYCAYTGLHLNAFQNIAVFLACVLMQSAVNTLNDYIDYIQGTDSADDNVEVSDAVLVYQNINPKSALALGAGYLGAGALLGILASIFAGFVPVLIGLIGGITVILYSGGPLPVSYLPIGEIVSGFVMGGLIPLGTAALSDNQLHFSILFWALPMIISIGLIMMSNNGSDIEKDIQADRKTLPTYLGRERTKALYHVLVIIWVLLLCILPIMLSGIPGLLSTVLILLVCRDKFTFLAKADLEPAGRIKLMKTVTAANLFGNGAYILAIVFGIFLKGIMS